jgi:hypothetical protein
MGTSFDSRLQADGNDDPLALRSDVTEKRRSREDSTAPGPSLLPVFAR